MKNYYCILCIHYIKKLAQTYIHMISFKNLGHQPARNWQVWITMCGLNKYIDWCIKQIKQKYDYLMNIDSILNLPLSRTYTWYTVSKPWVHLQGRSVVFSSFSRIIVATWMHRRHDEWTAAISIRALKESEGPSNFHLKKVVIQNLDSKTEDEMRSERLKESIKNN